MLEAPATWTEKLLAVTSAFSRARTAREVGNVAVSLGVEALGATSGALALVSLDAKHADVVAATGLERESREPHAPSLPAADQDLARDAVEQAVAVFVETPEEDQRRDPERALLAGGPGGTRVAVPLLAGDHPIGVLVFGFSRWAPLSPGARSFVQALASLCMQALDRARLLDAEQQARREAETASRAKDEFLAMLGHELRNPLSPMITALELMRLRGGDVLERERTIVERQVQHLTRLVDDLLDVSRITRGKIQLKRRLVEMGEVVENAIEMASPLLEARRHRLDADVPRRGLLVEGDPDRLAQVLANLLTNAAKYTQAEGEVRVRASREGSQVVVRVRDSGMGIAPELLPRVFDLFVQGYRALDRSQGGLGLGLTIVRSLVDMHGGAVSAASEGMGKGSEFTVRLPAATAAALTPAPGALPAVAGRQRLGAGRRVLVVDDNQDAADALVDALGAHGVAAAVAYDGPGAIEAALRFRPEAAFLDIGLPVMDGYELARRLRELLGPAIRLVALTGYGQDRDRALSRAAGFDEHLVKPVELEHIVALIHELFEHAEAPGTAAP